MGILYIVSPLDEKAKGWLDEQGIEFPDTDSRWPTRSEIETVLGELREIKVDYTTNGPGARWDAFVSDDDEDGNWTLLHADPLDGDDNCTELSFEKGEPTLIVAILRALAAKTGPFMLLPDVGCPPMVVTIGKSIPDTVADFCSIDTDSPKWQRLIQCAPGAASAQ